MSTEALTRQESINLDTAQAQRAVDEAALRAFMEMTQPAVGAVPSEAAPVSRKLESEHVERNLYTPLEAPAFSGNASAEFTPWYHDSPTGEAPVEAPTANPWFTETANPPAVTRQPQLIDQGVAGTHTAVRTGGWVDRDTPLPVDNTPANDEWPSRPTTGTVYRSASAEQVDDMDAYKPEPNPFANRRPDDDTPDLTPSAAEPQHKQTIPNLYHAADRLADMGAVVPDSIQEVKDNYVRTRSSKPAALKEPDAYIQDEYVDEGYDDEEEPDAQDDLEVQDSQDPDPTPEQHQRSRHDRKRRMLITGPATLGAWLGIKQANLAENRQATYERFSPGMRRILRIADGIGIASIALTVKSTVQTVLAVKGIMGPSYGTSDAFRDVVDGLTHRHSSLVELQHHDIPAPGGNTGGNAPPNQGYDYDSATRTAQENDPLNNEPSNVTGWSEQSLEASLRDTGIPEDQVQQMVHDPNVIAQLNDAFYHQNPVVGEDAHHWLNAKDTYHIGDVEKLADHMAAQRAAELGIHLPDETATGTSGIGTANGGEIPAPATQEPTLFDQERYDRWLAGRVKADALTTAGVAASSVALVGAGKFSGRAAAAQAWAAGVGDAVPRTPGRIRSALRRVLRRGPRP